MAFCFHFVQVAGVEVHEALEGGDANWFRFRWHQKMNGFARVLPRDVVNLGRRGDVDNFLDSFGGQHFRIFLLSRISLGPDHITSGFFFGSRSPAARLLPSTPSNSRLCLGSWGTAMMLVPRWARNIVPFTLSVGTSF